MVHLSWGCAETLHKPMPMLQTPLLGPVALPLANSIPKNKTTVDAAGPVLVPYSRSVVIHRGRSWLHVYIRWLRPL